MIRKVAPRLSKIHSRAPLRCRRGPLERRLWPRTVVVLRPEATGLVRVADWSPQVSTPEDREEFGVAWGITVIALRTQNYCRVTMGTRWATDLSILSHLSRHNSLAQLIGNLHDLNLNVRVSQSAGVPRTSQKWRGGRGVAQSEHLAVTSAQNIGRVLQFQSVG